MRSGCDVIMEDTPYLFWNGILFLLNSGRKCNENTGKNQRIIISFNIFWFLGMLVDWNRIRKIRPNFSFEPNLPWSSHSWLCRQQQCFVLSMNRYSFLELYWEKYSDYSPRAKWIQNEILKWTRFRDMRF